MNTVITYPRDRFLEDFRALQRGADAGTPAAGMRCSSESVELLVSDSPAATRRFRLALVANLGSVEALPEDLNAILYLGTGTELGKACGLMRTDTTHVERITHLRLVGPGMETIELVDHPRAKSRKPRNGEPDFSRVAGAMGENWHHISTMRFALVGLGRLGSTVALILARSGVRNFTLIDADPVESHNVAGGMAYTSRDVGAPKVEAMAKALVGINPACDVQTIAMSISSWRAVHELAESDVIISCADGAHARLAAAGLTAVFHKPLLDVGTGVFAGEDGGRQIGADVRLVWPGRCLLCSGAVRGEAGAAELLRSAEEERLHQVTPRDWTQERAGSLTSLNTTAAGIAVRFLEEFIAGSLVRNPAWCRLEWVNGRMRMTEPRTAGPTGNCLCELAGLGDAGISVFSRWLQREHPHTSSNPQA